MNIPKKPHKHQKLIKEWADDDSLPCWIWSEGAKQWNLVFLPKWNPVDYFAMGEKPTLPPRKTCTLGGVEFPAPESKAPIMGQFYYSFSVTSSEYWTDEWTYSPADLRRLENGWVHLTAEAAAAHTKAIISANLKAIPQEL